MFDMLVPKPLNQMVYWTAVFVVGALAGKLVTGTFAAVALGVFFGTIVYFLFGQLAFKHHHFRKPNPDDKVDY